jgi:hypothetical protein
MLTPRYVEMSQLAAELCAAPTNMIIDRFNTGVTQKP